MSERQNLADDEKSTEWRYKQAGVHSESEIRSLKTDKHRFKTTEPTVNRI